MSGLSLSPSSELVGPCLIKIAAAESPGQGRERGRGEARIKSGGGTRERERERETTEGPDVMTRALVTS